MQFCPAYSLKTNEQSYSPLAELCSMKQTPACNHVLCVHCYDEYYLHSTNWINSIKTTPSRPGMSSAMGHLLHFP